MPETRNAPPNSKRRYRRITSEEIQAIIDLYLNRGMSSVEIGRKLDRDPAIVRRVLHDNGTATPKLKWDADLALQLIGQGTPMAEVSRIVGKDAKSIRQYLARHTRRG